MEEWKSSHIKVGLDCLGGGASYLMRNLHIVDYLEQPRPLLVGAVLPVFTECGPLPMFETVLQHFSKFGQSHNHDVILFDYNHDNRETDRPSS